MKILEKPITFIKEVKAELGKVAWSTREELFASTMVVLAATGIVALFIFAVDIVLSKFVGIMLE
jgi:preprotein translocase subunit SecE